MICGVRNSWNELWDIFVVLSLKLKTCNACFCTHFNKKMPAKLGYCRIKNLSLDYHNNIMKEIINLTVIYSTLYICCKRYEIRLYTSWYFSCLFTPFSQVVLFNIYRRTILLCIRIFSTCLCVCMCVCLFTR